MRLITSLDETESTNNGVALLATPFDGRFTQPSPINLNYSMTVGLTWQDSGRSLTAAVLHAGNIKEYMNISVAAESSLSVRCASDFSTGSSTLVLLFVLANYTPNSGSVTMTMNSNNSSPITANVLPGVPFVWSSQLGQMNPIIPDGITSFLFTNPNVGDADVQIRILAFQ